MKKIYMILALAIIGLIASIRPVFSQGCEVCQNPWMCKTIFIALLSSRIAN